MPVVHAVTTDEIVRRPTFLDRAADVMRALGARGAVHLRAPHTPGRTVYELATALAELQSVTKAWLVVNDRVDVALAAGARGAQLTSRSMLVTDARRIAPRLALGASVHAFDQAWEAAADGANWLVAGNVFDTATHPGAAGRGLDFLKQLVASTALPVIAIGGLQAHHLSGLRDAGAHGAAAIRGIWDAENAERAALDYLSSYDAHRAS